MAPCTNSYELSQNFSDYITTMLLLVITLSIHLHPWWQVKSSSVVRDGERFAGSRVSNQEATVHRLVQGAHHQEPQRPPGGTQEMEC